MMILHMDDDDEQSRKRKHLAHDSLVEVVVAIKGLGFFFTIHLSDADSDVKTGSPRHVSC